MSAGLMSCVRENSPPLDLDAHASGPLSLPESSSNSGMAGITSTPLGHNMTAHSNEGVNAAPAAAPNAEQQKRRRFHPLRNLRRIFRRRTITSVADTPSSTSTPPTSSTSEKNLRSATLSSISGAVSASSPSSPLTHQQLQDAYSSQSLPKSKSYSVNVAGTSQRDALLASVTGGHKFQQQPLLQLVQRERKEATGDAYDADMYGTAASATAAYQQHHHAHSQYQRQTLGVAVLPSAMSRSFYTERQKLRSIGDSSQDLDSSGNDSAGISGATMGGSGSGVRANLSGSGGEMSDSQRSLSEGRLVDSDYSRDQLSQSHDSVFSESATASSLSIVLKAELADVLRKRRNRPDASDEDLGLPRSPASPQRRNEHHSNNASASMRGGSAHNNSSQNNTNNTAGNHSEVSSLSLLSMNSTDGEDALLANSTANNSAQAADVLFERTNTSTSRYTRSTNYSALSTSSSCDNMRHSMGASYHETKDEVDLFSSNWQRLSHSAAKHKMAVRPTKKKGPSRQHRRTLETSIPEANEDIHRASSNHYLDAVDHVARAKTRSLPPSVNAKQMEQHADDKPTTATAMASDTATNLKPTKAERDATNTKITTSPTSGASNITSSTTNSSSSSNMFGLRALTAKASAIFEPRVSTSSEADNKPKDTLSATSSSTSVETTESGFLRRLIQRNSKRSIAKANGGDDELDSLDSLQSEPKKLQISSSCYDTRHGHFDVPADVQKSKSVIACEDTVEERRREIKREIKSEGKSGLSAMLNNFMLAERSGAASSSSPSKESLTKPKSGPAARQRYMPQDIGGTLEKKSSADAQQVLSGNNSLRLKHYQQQLESNSSSTSTDAKESLSFSSSSNSNLLIKQYQQETFQSTSIIREITASQTASASNSTYTLPPKSELHFEKKPKIVGLSAFQQKISRSNDSFVRSASNNSSNNSLENLSEAIFLNYEQKQRRSVEKSRSFRNYPDESCTDTPSSVGLVHSNMPSLPDLSLNLRVPCFSGFILSDKEYSSPSPPEAHDKSVSLGFEINDNNLLRPAMRAESASQLTSATSQSSHNKHSLLNTKTTPNKQLFTPTTVLLPNLSPSSSCNQNISEIEQNIDLIVKSPFVSVLRKSDNTLEELVNNNNNKARTAEPSPQKSQESLQAVRPTVLQLSKQRTFNDDQLTPSAAATIKTAVSPSSSATTPSSSVPLREKTRANGVTRTAIGITTTATEAERKSAPQAGAHTNAKETERRSAPQASSSSCKSARRSSGVIEHAPEQSNTAVPEFMKIQLNRVDTARTAKSNVVLAKNVKESTSPPAQAPPSTKEAERCASADDLLLRRYSNDSVDISEKESESEDVEKRGPSVFEAINMQAKSLSTCNVRSSSTELPPKSPNRKSIQTAVTQPSESDEPVVVLRAKSNESVVSVGNKLSLQERKRLFMNEERAKTDKKLEELRNERKKSINEEVQRKSCVKSEQKLDVQAAVTTPTQAAKETVEQPLTPTLTLEVKHAMKLSAGQTQKQAATSAQLVRETMKQTVTQTPTPPVTPTEPPTLLQKVPPTVTPTEPTDSAVVMRKKSFGSGTLTGSAISSSKKDDATPELMKVFARRSLKIKEEDLHTLADKLSAPIANSSSSSNSSSNSSSSQQSHTSSASNSNSSLPHTTSLKRFASVQSGSASQQSVDSDKENQSASDEKLDKLPKYEVVMEKLTGISNVNSSSVHAHVGAGVGTGHSVSNRNSLADFRMSTVGCGKHGALSNGLTVSNNNNNNNSHSNGGGATTTSSTALNGSTKGGFLPSSRVSAFRNAAAERVTNGSLGKAQHTESLSNNNTNNNNNNNNNALNNNGHSKSAHERQTLNIKTLETATAVAEVDVAQSKSIERSATVGEFKGIHQRRAEWEQRAKEALK